MVASTNVEEACKGVDVAVMLGGFPRKAGMERKDVMGKNVSIYAAQAAALEKHANKGVKVGERLGGWVETFSATTYTHHINIVLFAPAGLHRPAAHAFAHDRAPACSVSLAPLT